MSRITNTAVDVAGKLLRKIPNIPGKNFYSKHLIKPFIDEWDIEQVLQIDSGNAKLICRLKDWIPWNIYLHGSYIVEEVYERQMMHYTDQSKVIFDVGANIGYYTVQFAQRTNGLVYAFEPMNYQYDVLLKNIELNKLSNICPVQKIVSDKNGIQRIYFSGMYNTAASSMVVETDDYEDVPSITLDTFCDKNEIEEVDMIKIDVEGNELNVLKGLKKKLESNKVNHIFIEIVESHLNKAGTGSEEVYNFLDNYNYTGYSLKSGKPEKYKIGEDESLVYFTLKN